MTSNINPATWASWNLQPSDKSFAPQMQLLLAQISKFALQTQQLLSQLNSASYLAGLLNGNAALLNTAVKFVSVDLGTVTTNQTVDCAGAISVAISFSFTAANTLTLTHLALGVPVVVRVANSSGGPLLFRVAATQPGGTAYSFVLWEYSSGQVDMSVGQTVASGVATVAAGAATPLTNWLLSMVAN